VLGYRQPSKMPDLSAMSEEQMQEETPVEEQTFQTEELDLEEEQVTGDNGEPDVEALKAENEKLKRTNAQLYSRYKEVKEKKPVEAVKRSNSNSSLTREEAILFAKGYTEEEVNLAVKLAKVNGVNALDAAEDDYFKTVVEKRQKKEQSAKASLGASSGANKFTPKSVGKMPEEEFQKYFHEVMSQV